MRDIDSHEVPVRSGEELVLQGVSASPTGSLFSHEGNPLLDVDLLIQRGRLNEQDRSKLDRRGSGLPPSDMGPLRVLPVAQPPSEVPVESCRTNIEVRLQGKQPAPFSLTVRQPEDPEPNRFRWLQIEPSVPAIVDLQVVTPPDPTAGCATRVAWGAALYDVTPPEALELLAARGSPLRFRFEPRSRLAQQTGFLTPFDVALQFAGLVVRKPDRSRDLLTARGRDGRPTLRLESLELGVDRLRIVLAGVGTLTGERAPRLLARWRERPARTFLPAIFLAGLDAAAGWWFVRRRRPPGAFRRDQNKALDDWRARLDFLQRKEAYTADPVRLFELKQLIEEAQIRIAELERR